MTQSGRGAAGPQETAAWQHGADPWPPYAPPATAGDAPDDRLDDVFGNPPDAPGEWPSAQEPPWEVDLRTDPPQPRYPSRRDLRDERDRLGEATFPAGPSTQELAVYRDHAAERHPAPVVGYPPQPGLVPWEGIQGDPGEGGRGDRFKRSVERWSRWASGLGLPQRDGSGYGRYARADRLLPPAVWIAAGLGAAGLVGLLTGVLVSVPSGGAPAAAPAVTSTATVKVTEQVTAPPVTETTTRTRTKTVTSTTTAAAPAQGAVGGVTLGPGSQGGRVARLQADLAALGLFQGPPNGTFDQRTAAGVQAFQAQNGVAGDPPGVAGPATLAAIDQALGR